MPQLSVVIITYNEEKNIGRCLESIKDIADDIVVVDAFSNDRTEKICRQYNANFIQREWQDFSTAKNFANLQARYDYIFSIDADEAISENLRNSIIKIKKEGFDGAYKMNRLTNYCGKWIKHCGWYPDSKIRIWNRNDGYWEGEVHEKTIFNKKLPTHFLKGDLLHYSFYTAEEYFNKAKEYSETSANYLFKKGKNANFLKIIFSPAVKFIGNYFFRLGFLDGSVGFTLCWIMAHATYLKYYKLHQLHKQSH